MFSYTEAINDTANTIFLNFYKSNNDRLLSSHDTNDLMDIISVDYNKNISIIEKDLSLAMKKLVNKMPHYYINQGVTYH